MNATAQQSARVSLIIDGAVVRTVSRDDTAAVQAVMREFYSAQQAGKAARIAAAETGAPSVEAPSAEPTVTLRQLDGTKLEITADQWARLGATRLATATAASVLWNHSGAPDLARFDGVRVYGTIDQINDKISELRPSNTDVDTDEDEEDEDTVEIPRAVVAAALAQPVAPVEAGTVSAVAVARIEQQEAWASAAGFSLPAPIYAAGTRCIALGDENFAAERQRVADLPAFDEAARDIASRIRAENRTDVIVPMSGLTMQADGRLYLPTGDRVAVSRAAFAQLAVRGGFGAGVRYLAECCDPQRRALNVNADLGAIDEDRRAMLRTRRTPNGREVFAVVSPSYAPVDADRVLLAAAPVLADARGEVTYDGSSTRATALWMPDIVADLAAGDVFKSGVRVRTDDTGGGRIVVEAVLFRNRCLNLIIIGEAGVPTLQQVHRGDLGDIEGRIATAVEEARGLIAPFLESWGHARAAKVADPMETLRRLVYGGELAPPTKGERERALQALVAAWQKEPGDSWADIANAATRAAHEDRDFVQEYRDHLESRAARLVYAAR